uniref:Uncharacterized protein n=1 Tax=Rhizophora mucronata TaxID=61149 RepID=A0A2P2QBJ0_RHIMU
MHMICIVFFIQKCLFFFMCQPACCIKLLTLLHVHVCGFSNQYFLLQTANLFAHL